MDDLRRFRRVMMQPGQWTVRPYAVQKWVPRSEKDKEFLRKYYRLQRQIVRGEIKL